MTLQGTRLMLRGFTTLNWPPTNAYYSCLFHLLPPSPPLLPLLPPLPLPTTTLYHRLHPSITTISTHPLPPTTTIPFHPPQFYPIQSSTHCTSILVPLIRLHHRLSSTHITTICLPSHCSLSQTSSSTYIFHSSIPSTAHPLSTPYNLCHNNYNMFPP